MLETLMAIAAPYGPVGLLCLYFMWKEDKRDKSDAIRAAREADQESKREQWAKDRAEADLAMARSITILAERISYVSQR